MKYCMECGTKLTTRFLENEGIIPYCDNCGQYRFKVFSTAVSMIVMNPDKDKILLIKQYGKPFYILVAGYVNCGEAVENTVIREVSEELGRKVTEYSYNRSKYFSPSNTLMLNFTCIVDSESLEDTNSEIDSAKWFTIQEALENIKENSLAEEFLRSYVEALKK